MSSTSFRYDNSKSLSLLGLDYLPYEQTISEMTDSFLLSRSADEQHGNLKLVRLEELFNLLQG